jgi:hypothetical protein
MTGQVVGITKVPIGEALWILGGHLWLQAFRRRKLWQWRRPYRQARMIVRFARCDWHVMRGQHL